MGRGRAHRLDLGVSRVELFERAAAEQLALCPDRPEGHLGPAQAFEVEGMDTLGRRVEVHVTEVLAQKLVHLRAGQVVYFNLQRKLRSSANSTAGNGRGFTPGVEV